MVDILRHDKAFKALKKQQEERVKNGESTWEDLDYLKVATPLEARMKYGCVVRSLESALDVEATDEEWDLRTGILYNLAKAGRLDLSEDPGSLANPQVRRRARLDIDEYLNTLRQRSTPIAQALKSYDLKWQYLGFFNVRRFLLRDYKIMIRGVSNGPHLAHVGLEGDTVVSLSDGGPKEVKKDPHDWVFMATLKPI